MTYDYNSKIYLAEAVLNVKDLAGQTAFYTQIIGLDILSQTETEVVLGAGNKPLVHLIQTNREEAVKSSYGLYHMAILLPSREDLADVFKHIAELDYPFVGAGIFTYRSKIVSHRHPSTKMFWGWQISLPFQVLVGLLPVITIIT